MNKSIASLVVAAVVLIPSPSALAQNWVATGNGGDWGNSANWDSGVPDSAGDTANLSFDLTTTTQPNGYNVNLEGNTYTLGTLNLGTTTSGFFYLNNGTLNFDNNGNGAVLNDVATAAGEQLNNLVINLSDNLTINDNQNNTASTPYGFEFGYGVGTSVTGTGNLTINNNNPVGNSTGNGPIGVFGSVDNVGKIILDGTGTGTVQFFDSIGSNVTEIDQDSLSSSTSLNNGISGTSIIKISAGTLGFGGGSGFNNPTQVIVGDTATDGANSVLDIHGTSGWTMGSTQTLSGFGTVYTAYGDQALTTVAGSMISPGSVGHIGKLTVTANLTLADNTGLTFILGASGSNSSIEVDRTLTLPSLQLNLTLLDNAGADSLGSLGDGTYELISYQALSGVASTGDISSLFNITAPGGYTYALSDTSVTGPGQIDLTVSGGSEAIPEPGTWALLFGGFSMLGLLLKQRHRQV